MRVIRPEKTHSMKYLLTFLFTSFCLLGISQIDLSGYYLNPNDNIFDVFAEESDGLDSPQDLAFNPNDPTELWVINERTESSGGSTVTFRHLGTSSQDAIHLVDGNAWHFMSLPTAMAFGDNGNWASAPGVFDANHDGGTPFTGPSLWSSDHSVYAQYHGPGTNGSHLDMLHASPQSQGMAWEKDNVYWLFDGYHGHPVRYDFVEDHGPGASYHGDGKVWRYEEIQMSMTSIPSHMEFDAERKWLYMNDNGNDRIVRLDITTGTSSPTTLGQEEALAEMLTFTGATWEVIADDGFFKLCGLDVEGDQLIVVDNSKSEMIFYNVADTSFPEVGRVTLPYDDVRGIEVGPLGAIWLVDHEDNVLVRMSNTLVSNKEVETPSQLTIYPNPTSGAVHLSGALRGVEKNVTIADMGGRIVSSDLLTGEDLTLDLSFLPLGMYIVKVDAAGTQTTHRLVIQK